MFMQALSLLIDKDILDSTGVSAWIRPRLFLYNANTIWKLTCEYLPYVLFSSRAPARQPSIHHHQKRAIGFTDDHPQLIIFTLCDHRMCITSGMRVIFTTVTEDHLVRLCLVGRGYWRLALLGNTVLRDNS
jgi:hypothetical protein